MFSLSIMSRRLLKTSGGKPLKTPVVAPVPWITIAGRGRWGQFLAHNSPGLKIIVRAAGLPGPEASPPEFCVGRTRLDDGVSAGS